MKLSTKLITVFLFTIFLTIVLISWRGLIYFSMDKETYVQDLNSQNAIVLSKLISDRIENIEKLIETFSSNVFLKFKDRTSLEKAQMQFMSRFRDFLSVSIFKVGPSYVKEEFSLNVSNIDKWGITKKSIMDKKFIRDIYQKHKTNEWKFTNFTKKSDYPVILFSIRKPGGLFVHALVPQVSIMKAIGSKEIYETFVVDSNGELLMHQNPNKLITTKKMNSHPMVKQFVKDSEKRSLSRTTEYFLEDTSQNMLGAWAHIGNTGLGLFIETSRSMAYEAARALIEKLALWIGIIFIIAITVSVIFAAKITNPLKTLVGFARKIGKGDFNVNVPIKSKDELGALAGAFNTMGTELKAREEKIEESHKQLVQSEKMSAFGQMSAGIAHEVKNPLAGILGYAQIAKKKSSENPSLQNYLGIIEKETKRCKEIVENLMKFARSEKAEFSDIFFYQVVKDAVALVDHQITISGIKIIRKFPQEDVQGPQISGNSNQIIQVLTNIMLNAQYAMKKKGDNGTLTIELFPEENGKAKVTIEDTGTGIKPENIAKLFDPFFTTKPPGEGTGLGLSVTFGIIRDHKGEIKVESEYGQWTRFIISLPVKSA